MLRLTFLDGAAAIGLALSCTGCATQPVPPMLVPPPVPPTAWVQNAKITAIAVPETDESHLLDLSMWKFDVAAPKPAHEIKLIIEAQEAGKPPREILSMPFHPQIGWPMNKHLGIFVGQVPLYDGQGMKSKATYQIRTSSFYSAPLRQQGEDSEAAVADNPLDGLAETSEGSPQRCPDGSFILTSGHKTNFFAANAPPDAAVVFRVEEEAY